MAYAPDSLRLLIDTLVLPKGAYVSTPRLDLHATNFTIATKLFLDSIKVRNIVLGNWGAAGNSWQLLLAVNVGGQIVLNLRRDLDTNGSNPEQDLITLVSSAPVTEKAWHHIAATFDWGADGLHPLASLYLDGKPVGSQEGVIKQLPGLHNPYTLKFTHNPYLIGHKEDASDDSSWFSGQLKDFLIYDSAIAASDLPSLIAP